MPAYVGVSGLFGGLVTFVHKRKEYLDNPTFQLHYRATFIFLMVSCILSTGYSFVGDPMQCFTKQLVLPSKVVNTYCYIQSTYTIPEDFPGQLTGCGNPNWGVGATENASDVLQYRKGMKVHAYYQWVPFLLLLQSLLFYAPHLVWKCLDNGKLKMLIQDLNRPILEDPENKRDNVSAISKYLIRSLRMHNCYAFKFVFCEFLNFANITGQFFLVNAFLGGEFLTAGLRVIKSKAIYNSLYEIFPKVTKCTYFNYAVSGRVESKDTICVLAINMVNEMVYIFLWFWILFLFAWTAFHLLIKLLTLVSWDIRVVMLSNRCPLNKRRDIADIMSHCLYGDWFILMQLAKSMDLFVLETLINDLRDRLVLNHNSKCLNGQP